MLLQKAYIFGFVIENNINNIDVGVYSVQCRSGCRYVTIDTDGRIRP